MFASRRLKLLKVLFSLVINPRVDLLAYMNLDILNKEYSNTSIVKCKQVNLEKASSLNS